MAKSIIVLYKSTNSTGELIFLFEIISGPLHLLALTPINYNSSQASDWSIKTRKSLLTSKFMLSRPMYEDRYYLKAVMGNPNTKSEDLKILSNLINHSII